MALVSMRELLDHAAANGYGIPAFNVNNLEQVQAVMQAADELRSIPGIRFLDYGTALPSSRPVVDDSFDVAFVMRFESAAALQAYETNPAHVKKVETVLKPLAGKILVYDVTR